MKLIDQTGHFVETANPFVIEQLLKYGAKEVPDEKPKKKAPKKEA